MKLPTRPSVGEQRAPGEVKPVTNKTVFGILAAVIAVVVIAIGALILASGSPKTTTNTDNVPRAIGSGAPAATSSTTYRESVTLPSGSEREQVVPAVLTLRCSGVCTGGTLQGYLGTYTLTTVFGATTQLNGTLDGSCETITLLPQGDLKSAPQIFTGTITRPNGCTNTSNASPVPVTLRLDRT